MSLYTRWRDSPLMMGLILVAVVLLLLAQFNPIWKAVASEHAPPEGDVGDIDRGRVYAGVWEYEWNPWGYSADGRGSDVPHEYYGHGGFAGFLVGLIQLAALVAAGLALTGHKKWALVFAAVVLVNVATMPALAPMAIDACTDRLEALGPMDDPSNDVSCRGGGPMVGFLAGIGSVLFALPAGLMAWSSRD